MAKSAIEWTDSVWNPVSGCTRVSAGCDTGYLWMFFGVLADERKLRTVAWRIEYHHAASLLESIMAAVCEAVERQAQTAKTPSEEGKENDDYRARTD